MLVQLYKLEMLLTPTYLSTENEEQPRYKCG